jgi:hypothetical protein
MYIQVQFFYDNITQCLLCSSPWDQHSTHARTGNSSIYLLYQVGDRGSCGPLVQKHF